MLSRQGSIITADSFKSFKIGDFQTNKLPAVAVAITGTTLCEVEEQLSIANESSCDVIEWRIDYLLKNNLMISSEILKKIFNQTSKPLILTWRTIREGGQYSFERQKYCEIYKLAVDIGFQAVDIEFAIFPELFDLISQIKGRASIICSWHDFNQVPNDLYVQAIEMSLSKSDVIKIAVMPHNEKELDEFLTITKKINEKISQPLISIAMGSIGSKSRVIGHKYGSSLTFGQIGHPSAPGQFNVEKLRKLLF
jgi:3-dehydroquinate dehydratase I